MSAEFYTMRNMIRPRKAIRAEALRAVAADIRQLRCPTGQEQLWEREYRDAIDAVVRTLENQIAQAEGTVTFRRARPQEGGGPGCGP
jgi:hypothetical protein